MQDEGKDIPRIFTRPAVSLSGPGHRATRHPALSACLPKPEPEPQSGYRISSGASVNSSPLLHQPSCADQLGSGLTPSLPKAHLGSGQYKHSLCLEAALYDSPPPGNVLAVKKKRGEKKNKKKMSYVAQPKKKTPLKKNASTAAAGVTNYKNLLVIYPTQRFDIDPLDVTQHYFAAGRNPNAIRPRTVNMHLSHSYAYADPKFLFETILCHKRVWWLRLVFEFFLVLRDIFNRKPA